MDVIWNEARIRAVIKGLDQKTGLNGAQLPIKFNHAKRTLGSFCSCSGKAKMFQFSNFYFQNPDFPFEEAMDTILHEYAHYMDFMINGKTGHGTSWKQCCIRIGAMPVRLYSEERAEYYRLKHEKERRENCRIDGLSPGTVIEHPRFGRGEVRDLEGEGTSRVLHVAFPGVGTKLLGASWVLTNCRI